LPWRYNLTCLAADLGRYQVSDLRRTTGDEPVKTRAILLFVLVLVSFLSLVTALFGWGPVVAGFERMGGKALPLVLLLGIVALVRFLIWIPRRVRECRDAKEDREFQEWLEKNRRDGKRDES